MIVVDASVLAVVVGDDTDDGARFRERLHDQRLFAPEVVDLEVTSYVRRAGRSGQLRQERAVQALAELAMMALSRVSHTPFLSRIWDLRDNLTPYDAAYVALAETLEAPLLTADVRLSRAPGIRCEVVVLS
jgi:predicted nucleic acid-binding protein